MHLPKYSGRFDVGAIDLEIPVREPRSFGTEYVPNDQINKPKRHADLHKRAKASSRKAKEAARKRLEEDGPDFDASADAGPKEKEEVNVETRSNGSPFASGSGTTTLHLSTVLFTLYYPTDDKMSDRYNHGLQYSNVAWMGRPKRKGAEAFLQYLGQYGAPLAVLASPAILTLVNAKIEAIAGARLADPSSAKASTSSSTRGVPSETAMFPVVIFTHGLAGNRLSYSQYCGELASQGVVIAALEHRDGSGISSIVRLPRPNDSLQGLQSEKKEKRTATTTKLEVPYLVFEKIGLRGFALNPSEKEAGLRKAQLAMRSAEIKECLYLLREIQSGRGEEIAKNSTRHLTSKLGQKHSRGKMKKFSTQEDAKRLQAWQGKIDTGYPGLVGHSFGGATVIEMQRQGPIVTEKGEQEANEDSTRESDSSPFPYSIILDPWVDPIEWRGEGEEIDPRPMIKSAYVINSETFTIWKDHFAKLKRIMHDSREAKQSTNDDEQSGWLMSLAGCQHLDFSDFPFLLPHLFRSTVGPSATVAIFSRATYAQMSLLLDRKEVKEKGETHHVITDLPVSCKEEGREDAVSSIRLGVTEKGQSTAREQSEVTEDGNSRSRDEQSTNDGLYWSTSVNDSSLLKDQLTSAKEKKERAGERVWRAKVEREEQERLDERRTALFNDRKARGLVAVVAERTASGNVKTAKGVEGEVDFSVRAKDVEAGNDAEEVHKCLEEISDHLNYKKPKILSLSALLFRLKGLHPGIEQPGKVLIHHY
ncbi:hypothetical protein CBS101457_003406 [Exobasidium rhododendri]|nr:hypothetical protein CBS101457_003406 [Exobasidium rhododendri]